MKRIILLSLLSFVLAPRVMAQLEMTKAQYIEKFRHIAIAEMDRSGIPASIKLAQGILESRFGNSSLATEANNHFGIKCHRGWNGKRYYLKDDDLDENGDLIESCFRVYTDAQSSYVDHTEFLMSRDRYAFIFQYDNTDYKNWAKGLKKAGYATNPSYADILIRVVQENKLQKYDKMTSDVPVVINEEDIIEEPFPIQPNESMVVDFFPRKGNKSEAFFVNDIKTVTAWPEETMISIAQQNDVALNRLMKYNDMKGSEEPMAGQYIFLQPNASEYLFGACKSDFQKNDLVFSQRIALISIYRFVRLRMFYGDQGSLISIFTGQFFECSFTQFVDVFLPEITTNGHGDFSLLLKNAIVFSIRAMNYHRLCKASSWTCRE
ncbi:MAG: glucosaminidase domain-containing protein [Bacteroidota bacterium]